MKTTFKMIFAALALPGSIAMPNMAWGQTTYEVNTKPLYCTNKIYIRLKMNSNLDLLPLPFNNTGNAVASATNLSNINNIFLQRQVVSVDKPFAALNTPLFDRIYCVTFNDSTHTESFITEMNTISDVDFAEKVSRVYLESVPNETNMSSYSAQNYHLFKTNTYSLTNSNSAYDLINNVPPNTTPKIIIAMVDDALSTSHQDLLANLWTNANGHHGHDVTTGTDDPNPTNPYTTHGTHVAGIIGATTNNLNGTASVGMNKIEVMGIKTKFNTVSGYDFYGGLAYAASKLNALNPNGIKIINNSWGGGAISVNELEVVRHAHYDLGCIIVAAAGNGSNGSAFYPASLGAGFQGEAIDKNYVIAVGALDDTDHRSTFSNAGTWVDIFAYGTDIYSTVPGGNNDLMEFKPGTSMAAPFISGLLGLMAWYNPQIDPNTLVSCLLGTANPDIYTSNPNAAVGTLGRGRVDAYAALRCALPTCTTNPIATIASNKDYLCPSGTITLTANIGNMVGITPTYLWSNGSTSNTTTISTAGTYSVTVTTGACSTSSQYTVVGASANAVLSVFENSLVPNDGIFCSYANINLDVQPAGTSYAWSGRFASFTTTNSITVGYIANVLFTETYTVTVTNVGGCAGLTAVSNPITVTGYPTVNASITVVENSGDPTDKKVCKGAGATLTAVGGVNYVWTGTNGGGTTYIGNTQSVTVYPNYGTNYQVKVTDAGGCSTEVNQQIDLYPTSPTIGITGNTIILGSTPVILTAWSNVNSDFVWNTGSTNPIISVTNPGTYTVTVTGVGGICSVTASITITQANCTVSINSGTQICVGGTRTLIADATNSAMGGSFTYNWSNGMPNNSTIVTTPGNYTVTATHSSGCVTSTVVTVTAYPSINVTIGGNTTISQGGSTNLTAYGGNTYHWSNNTNSATNSVSPTSNTVYTVTVTNGNGCTASSTVEIIVLSPCLVIPFWLLG